MKSSDLRLDLVRIESISGSAFGQNDNTHEAQLKAIFKAQVVTELEGMKKGDNFELRLLFTAIIGEDESPSFEIEIAGTFIVEDEHVLKELKSEAGAHEAASLLFPYIRNFSKPILESLGTANIEFPFFIPKPPVSQRKVSEKSKRSVRGRSSATSNSE